MSSAKLSARESCSCGATISLEEDHSYYASYQTEALLEALAEWRSSHHHIGSITDALEEAWEPADPDDFPGVIRGDHEPPAVDEPSYPWAEPRGSVCRHGLAPASSCALCRNGTPRRDVFQKCDHGLSLAAVCEECDQDAKLG